MNVLIGDIGNTITKICLVEIKKLKLKKIIYFNSSYITSKNYLKKNLKTIIKNKSVNKIALFSSVVPKYQLLLSISITLKFSFPFVFNDKNLKADFCVNIGWDAFTEGRISSINLFFKVRRCL